MLILKWAIYILVGIGLVEALFLIWKRPQSFILKESLVTWFLTLVKPQAILFTQGFFSQNLATIWIFGGAYPILSLLWPHRIFTVPLESWWATPVLVLGMDFLYYWEHRLKHTSRWFWANHSVHHSPQVMNFSTGIRVGWTGALGTNVVFFLPLVLFGYPPKEVTIMLFIHTLYQFWLHSEWIPKLGLLEWVMTTPSNHRVHHAKNPEYIDRNFGGFFIIFDRLFGTFVEEKGPCQYGLVKPLNSHNPIRILTYEWFLLYQDVKKTKGLREALLCLFGPLRPSFDDGKDLEIETKKVS